MKRNVNIPPPTRPVNPSRFLWHITYSNPSKDKQIRELGLLPHNGGVWAHNQEPSFEVCYPCFLDSWDVLFQAPYSSQLESTNRLYSQYTFWRIDTLKCDNKWHVDPFMEIDCKVLDSNPKIYIFTKEKIPSDALTPFEFDLESYTNRYPKIIKSKGSAHIIPVNSDFGTLRRMKI
jgi:hypothetical protein